MQNTINNIKIETKALLKNKEWLLYQNEYKIGSICKEKNKYFFLKSGKKVEIKSLSDFEKNFGIKLSSETKIHQSKYDIKQIYGYPCKNKPISPVYDIKKKLPLYLKRVNSKSYYCAGYYLIKIKKGWVKNYCPKLITLDNNLYHGPFKSEYELKQKLIELNNYEKHQHLAD
jgi:hypothetical protein